MQKVRLSRKTKVLYAHEPGLTSFLDLLYGMMPFMYGARTKLGLQVFQQYIAFTIWPICRHV